MHFDKQIPAYSEFENFLNSIPTLLVPIIDSRDSVNPIHSSNSRVTTTTGEQQVSRREQSSVNENAVGHQKK